MIKNTRFLTTTLISAAIAGTLSVNAEAVTALPSTHKLYVNNQIVDAAAYNIEGSNYFKLRDIAKLVNFYVSYDPKVNCVSLASDQPYEDDGSQVVTTVSGAANAQPSSQAIYVNGVSKSPTVYNINGNNFFKLRDLGEMIDFNVTFTATDLRVDIQTDQPYQTEPETANPVTPEEATAIWKNFLSSKNYTSYASKDFADYMKKGLEYVITDLNADTIPELLIQSTKDRPFFCTWLFTLDGGDIALVTEIYGYGSFRYSPSKNAINGSPEFKPFSGTGYAPFYRLQGVQLEYMFEVGQDERKSYYSDSTGNKAISDEERAAYFRDIINFKWDSL